MVSRNLVDKFNLRVVEEILRGKLKTDLTDTALEHFEDLVRDWNVFCRRQKQRHIRITGGGAKYGDFLMLLLL